MGRTLALGGRGFGLAYSFRPLAQSKQKVTRKKASHSKSHGSGSGILTLNQDKITTLKKQEHTGAHLGVENS